MDEEEANSESPKKKSKLFLIVGLILALVGGGGGFFAVQSGVLFGGPSDDSMAGIANEEQELPKVAFVPVDPLVINLNGNGNSRFLRFRVELEVNPEHEAEIVSLLPRIIDVMNGYLRAVSIPELEAQSALIKLRSQLLRRIQLVTGDDRVHDVLIMEFVIN